MNNNFIIKNFRVFDNEGVSLPIKPMTILTGCNSSGKSSVVKSMVLLDSYLEKLQDDFKAYNKIDLTKHILDFSTKENSTLGSFNRVLHRGSDSSILELGYTVNSLLLAEEVKVSFFFSGDENDDLNNGYIQGLSITTADGCNIYTSKRGENTIGNFGSLLNNFYRFVYGQYLINCAKNLQAQKILGELSDNELAEYQRDYTKFKDDYYQNFGKESLQDYLLWEQDNYPEAIELAPTSNLPLVRKHSNGHPEIIDKSLEKETLFYSSIIDNLVSLDKDSIEGFVMPIAEKNNYLDIKPMIKKVLDDFRSSSFSTFGDYYHQKEVEFLCPSFRWKKRSPKLFRPNNWNVIQDGLWGPSSDFFITDTGECCITNSDDNKDVTFDLVYETIVRLDHIVNENSIYYKKNIDPSGYETYTHYMFEMFKDYISLVLTEVLTRSMPQNVSYISSSLVDVKRLYSLESNDAFSILLKNYFNAKRGFLKTKNEKDPFMPGDFLNKWIRKFDVGYSVKLNIDEEGTGVNIRVYENEEDKAGCLLSDLGYGITQLFVVLLRIETAIMESHPVILPQNENHRYIGFNFFSDDDDVIIIRSASTLAIEEPEIHQHPKFQSMLAELFVDAFLEYNVQFIIETHSEYLIRKLQTLIAENKVGNDKVSILYVYDSDPAKRPIYTPQVKAIDILSDGRLSDKFGEGFFDEADRLAMDLLTIKTSCHD